MTISSSLIYRDEDQNTVYIIPLASTSNKRQDQDNLTVEHDDREESFYTPPSSLSDTNGGDSFHIIANTLNTMQHTTSTAFTPNTSTPTTKDTRKRKIDHTGTTQLERYVEEEHKLKLKMMEEEHRMKREILNVELEIAKINREKAQLDLKRAKILSFTEEDDNELA